MSVFDPNQQITCADSRIVAALERLAEAFKGELLKAYKQHHLSPLQVQVLIYLLFNPQEQRTVSGLAQNFKVTKATISDAIRTLEAKNLLDREPCTQDTRRIYLNLTPEGQAMAKEVSLFANGILKAVQTLSEDKKSVVLEALLQLIHQLQQTGIISLTRMCFSCQHYQSRPDINPQHYCNLMDKPLAPNQLRLHCPEHAPLH